MELVIKIAEKTFDDLVKHGMLNYTNTGEIIKSIKDGTPLPKGHGRLIDANVLENEFDATCSGECGYCCDESKCPVYNQSTVIEADSEVEE